MAIQAILKPDGVTVVTGIVRLGYVNVFEPRAFEGQKPAYSVQLLIPKDDKHTIKCIKEAIENAKEKGKGLWGGTIPPNLKTILRDGDKEHPDDEIYEGKYFLNARNVNRKPKLLAPDGTEYTEFDKDEIYSGCWGLAIIELYPYNSNGSKGVTASLNAIKKKKDDTRLGGTRDTDFGGIDDDEDEDDEI